MKVVFPCSGSLVLLKEDLEILKSFYKTNLLNSKMASMYKNSTTIIQVNNFNYFPPSNSLVLYNANVLTIEKMRKILGINNEAPAKKQERNDDIQNTKEQIDEDQDYITDDDLLSNSFFTTLAPLN